MQRYIELSKLQKQICLVLLTLATSDEISRALSDKGISPLLVSTMVKHRFDVSVQQYGCWAISNMAAAGEDVRRKLKKAGILEVISIIINIIFIIIIINYSLCFLIIS